MLRVDLRKIYSVASSEKYKLHLLGLWEVRVGDGGGSRDTRSALDSIHTRIAM